MPENNKSEDWSKEGLQLFFAETLQAAGLTEADFLALVISYFKYNLQFSSGHSAPPLATVISIYRWRYQYGLKYKAIYDKLQGALTESTICSIYQGHSYPHYHFLKSYFSGG